MPGLVEPFSLGLVYERRRGESEADARLELSAARVPLGLLRHVAGRAVPVGALEGPTLESLSWTRGRGRAKLRVGDGALALECAGVQEEGLLRTEPGLPASLVLDPGTPAGEFLLARLVPLLVPQVLPGERRVTFEGEGLVLPLAGGWDGLAGRVRFTLPTGTFRLDPAVSTSFGPTLALAPEALELELEVAGGRVLLDGLALPLAAGRLEYAGQVELATGQAEVSFVREHDGQRTPLGRWRGPVDELVPSMPVPPQVPEAGELGVDGR